MGYIKTLKYRGILMRCLFLVLVLTANLLAQSNIKEQYLKYYVAMFETNIGIEYVDKIDTNDSYKLYWLQSSIPCFDCIERYSVIKYIHPYLHYDVYYVLNDFNYPTVYTVGVDSSGNILKMSGFKETKHVSEDTSSFRQYNDSLYVQDLDLYRKNKIDVDNFVKDIFIFTQFETFPRDFLLVSNNYIIKNNNIIGECILYNTYSKVEINRKYIIPNTGVIKFYN